MQHPGIAELVRRDPRYAYEAYEFVFEALNHTQARLDRMPPGHLERDDCDRYHVSGPELLFGACELARKEFGWLSRTVFRLWGVERTDDFGALVFNLIDANLLSKTERDRLADFCGVFDMDRVMTEEYSIPVEESLFARRSPR